MSTPTLSIVIASLNDSAQLRATVNSIRATAEGRVEIVIVDDCSNPAVPKIEGTTQIRNPRRIGCGPSRHVGAQHAHGDFLLLIDSHCRFEPGWLEKILPPLVENPAKTLYCARCLALGYNGDKVFTDDMNTPHGTYSGATWNFCGGDRQIAGRHQVLECVWAKEQPGDNYEISAVMGACYFISREWFLEMDALRHLRLWGGDEQELSLKAWLSGGEIRLLKTVRIGHHFRVGGKAPYFVPPWNVIYNKLFIAHTCLPPDVAAFLQHRLGKEQQFHMALNRLHEDWNLVETARALNAQMFTRNFQWLIGRFQLSFPVK